MKVLMINGSPNQHGSTYTALCEVQKILAENGLDTEIFWIGREAINGCYGCSGCTKTNRCVTKDVVNEALDKADGADAIILGSPVHYAGIAGNFKSFLDRFFWAGNFALKPGAAVVVARRGGASATLDGLNKYFTIAQMPVVSSQYWNMIHGLEKEDLAQDLEGMQILRTLGRNMAWLLKSIEAGRAAGVALPKKERRAVTNFIH